MPHPTAPQHQEAQGFKQTEIQTNFDDLIEFLGDLCENTPPGMWVASTDMLLTVSGEKGEPRVHSCDHVFVYL